MALTSYGVGNDPIAVTDPRPLPDLTPILTNRQATLGLIAAGIVLPGYWRVLPIGYLLLWLGMNTSFEPNRLRRYLGVAEDPMTKPAGISNLDPNKGVPIIYE